MAHCTSAQPSGLAMRVARGTTVARAPLPRGTGRVTPRDFACSAEASRRDTLLTGLGLTAAPLLATLPASAGTMRTLTPDAMSAFQRQDQVDEMLAICTAKLKEFITGDDLPVAMRCALADAGSYDISSKTGGMNGSIQYELDRPANAGLKPWVEKLQSVKAEVDSVGKAQGRATGISFADLEVIAVKVAARASWRDIKVARSATGSGGNTIADQFASPYDLRLGRIDATGPDPEVAIPGMDDDVMTIKAYLNALGSKPDSSFLAPKPMFWEKPGFLVWTAAQPDPTAAEVKLADADSVYAAYKKSYDQSRKTVTRTDYEVDFGVYVGKLTSLGAKFDQGQYLYSVQVPTAKF